MRWRLLNFYFQRGRTKSLNTVERITLLASLMPLKTIMCRSPTDLKPLDRDVKKAAQKSLHRVLPCRDNDDEVMEYTATDCQKQWPPLDKKTPATKLHTLATEEKGRDE